MLAAVAPVARGTNIDSVTKQIAVLIEDNRLKDLVAAYDLLSKHSNQQRDYRQSLIWCLKGLEVAEVLDDRERQFDFLHLIGTIYFNPYDDYEQSLAYLQRAEEIGAGFVDKTKQARNLSQLAEVLNVVGAYNDALDYQLEAMAISRSVNDTATLALGYRNMGVLYWDQKQYDLSLKNFQQALVHYDYLRSRIVNDSVQLARIGYSSYICIASIGASYLELQKTDTALMYIRRARALADSIEHDYSIAYSEGLLGNVFMSEQQYDSAKVCLVRAVDAFRKLELKREWITFAVQLSEIHIRQQQPAAALRLLNEAESAALDLAAPTLLRDIYKNKYEAAEALDNINDAYTYLKYYVGYKDSLMNEKKLAQMAKVEHKYEVRAKEEEIAQLEQDRQAFQERLQLLGLIGSLLFMATIALLIWYRFRTLKNMNALLAVKNEEIKLQNERLASSNDDLRQFAHVASHDLREPLRSISSFASLLRRRYYGKIDDDANEFIDFITQGVSRMDALLTDLLAYSVVGIFNTEYSQVDINETIKALIQKLNREKALHGVRISIQNLPVITANDKQIQQLFGHLIDNAIKFRSDRLPEIRISASKGERGEYTFSVTDNGIGMEEAYTDKIFSPFQRLHGKESQYKGTGIGLSICKKIVEQHKGRIWIDSQLGVGTTVFFTLPETPVKPLVPARKTFSNRELQQV
ncbi:MAG: hypothetical protein OHK0039_27830 [Bacteroidia bacterium]